MKFTQPRGIALCTGALLLALPSAGAAQLQSGAKTSGKLIPGGKAQVSVPGRVVSHVKLSALQGGLQDPLLAGDQFGSAVISVGDVDGDGILDLAAGSRGDAALSTGLAWVLLMNADGTVKQQSSLEPVDGLGSSLLQVGDGFGSSLAPVGDLDGDGISEIVVGAPGANSGDGNLWVLFIGQDGALRAQQQIDGSVLGGGFATSLGALNDFDGDGLGDLAVGASEVGSGSIWMLYLQADGTEKSRTAIGAGLGGFSGALNSGDRFGSTLSSLGDLNGDRIADLAVGAKDDGAGALWVLFMNADGSVASETKIAAGQGMAASALAAGDQFGAASAFLGDLNGDDTRTIAVGAPGDDDGAQVLGSDVDRGAVWILFLNSDGSVSSSRKISNTRGRFKGDLEDGDCFGASLSALVNFAGSNTRGLAVGAVADDDMEDDSGAIYVLNLEGFVLLDFETAGDMMTPLPNGRALNPAVAYRQLVRISSDQVQNYGTCIFDSDPLGPNDPGADMDLLVGSGNILILQEEAAMTLPNIFDTPDDCRWGGTFIFDFTGRVELRTMLLLDVDPGFDEGCTVTMTDGLGRQRVFDVPAGWTDDLLSDPGAQGGRALDLRHLDPQPGFASTVTTTEDAGFSAIHVFKLTVSTSSSMAIDNLVFFPFD